MATFNGEKYIRQQLDSLFDQTMTDFIIHIQDDASTDNTWEILLEYKQKHPEKIRLNRRLINTGSAKYNFLGLMSAIQDKYVMLCDQDDVWFPTKIEKTLAKMNDLERLWGKDSPLLVFTDLQVVDETLTVINKSFREAMDSDFTRTDFAQVLIQNLITGCTVMYNRSLACLLDISPKYCVMHDWWLMLVASAFGKIGHIDEQTISYRQHGKNEIGAKDVRKLSYKFNRLLKGGSIREAIRLTYPQAKCFLSLYDNKLTDSQKDILLKYCSIPDLGKMKRWITIYELKALKSGLFRNIAYFIFV